MAYSKFAVLNNQTEIKKYFAAVSLAEAMYFINNPKCTGTAEEDEYMKHLTRLKEAEKHLHSLASSKQSCSSSAGSTRIKQADAHRLRGALATIDSNANKTPKKKKKKKQNKPGPR